MINTYRIEVFVGFGKWETIATFGTEKHIAQRALATFERENPDKKYRFCVDRKAAF